VRRGQGIRAVVFDWGGVLTNPPLLALYEVEAALGFSRRQLIDWLAHTGLPAADPGDEPEEDFSLLEKAAISFEEFSARLLNRAADHLGAPLSAESWARVCGAFVPDPGLETVHWAMIERARRLRRDGYRTAILTNQIASWRDVWRSSVPLADFDLVVDSCEAGVRKPEPAALQLVCDGLGVRPEEAVLLDDSPRNVAGAEAFGMSAILVRDPVSALADLDRLLGQPALTR
jgi:putative hydrolase of the HAD superfamily